MPCKILQIPFGHACWDSDCGIYCQANIARPSRLTRLALRQLSREDVRDWTPPAVDTRRAGGFTWGRALRGSDLPAATLSDLSDLSC